MFEQEKCDERRHGWQRGEHFHRGDERHRGRHGGFGGPMGHDRGFGGGGGRERHFDNGELRFVILQLIADKASYGYEIIKAIEERLSGAYAPSPGVVYPTLTMLEEEGLATVSSTEGSKKLYAATEQGVEYLKENKVVLKAIFGRMEQAGKAFGRGQISADYAGDHESPVCIKNPDRTGKPVTGTDSQSSGGNRCSGPRHR